VKTRVAANAIDVLWRLTTIQGVNSRLNTGAIPRSSSRLKADSAMKYPAQAESEGCQPTDQSRTITIVPNSSPAPIRESGMAAGIVSNKANPRVQNDDPTRNQASSK